MIRIYIIKFKVLKIIVTLMLCVLMLAFTLFYFNYRNRSSSESLDPNAEYVVLAMNDLGMHCIQSDYSAYLLFPPANNVKVQVFKKGDKEAMLINDGIEVKYEAIDNTTSADKVNFWQYAADYGYDVEPNVGITGNKLSGFMSLSSDKKYYEATAIPITPYNDGSTELNAYQTAKITVYDKSTGKVIAVCESVVVPVSNEMNCSVCHGETDTDLAILAAHDELSNTHLVNDLNNNIRHKCSDCHEDNALGEKGVEGVAPLSQAMHGFHSTKMELSDITPKCSSCHPGPITKCYRGVMYANGVSCDNSKCHGDMENIARSQMEGRMAWLQEPNCSNCHKMKYSTNQNVLYRNSYLMNAPAFEMNGLIQCISCHNSPHSEWPSTLAIDNKIPLSLQGTENYIENCNVCHEGKGKVHN
ncbi:MAG: hypothetical protein ACERKZ_14030 [Lachnotalea sp.]